MVCIFSYCGISSINIYLFFQMYAEIYPYPYTHNTYIYYILIYQCINICHNRNSTLCVRQRSWFDINLDVKFNFQLWNGKYKHHLGKSNFLIVNFWSYFLYFYSRFVEV